MTEQFKQAKREFWISVMYALTGESYLKHPAIERLNSDLTSLLEQHKEVMIREELIAYDKWLCQHDLGYDFDTTEKCVDEYIKSLKP